MWWGSIAYQDGVAQGQPTGAKTYAASYTENKVSASPATTLHEQTMRTRRQLTPLFFPLALCGICHAGEASDGRLTAISAAQLQRSLLHTPPDPVAQLKLLSRARHSHLLDVAYTQCTTLWERQPNDASANLIRGVCAEYLAPDSMEPLLKDIYGKYTRENLFSVASSCLGRAVLLAPHSPMANMEEGFFLWQFGERLPQGMAYLQAAIHLAPQDPRIHATLGDVYANSEGGYYDLQKASSQLDTAVRLDSTYAFPHDLLANIYTRLGQSAKAEEERDKYKSLVP